MNLSRTIGGGVALAGFLLASTSAFAATEIHWWHAMGGELGEKLEAVAEGFNETQSDWRVIPTYRGNYTETMTGAVAAFRAGEHPHIVQVFEVGTGTMMAAHGAVYPIYELMADAGEAFDREAYLPAVVGYYTDLDGNMLSFPFNSSTPILYYNKDAFQEAGLDPEQPPRTWAEMEEMGRQIVESGAADCGFTTAWQTWIQLENFSALHNVPVATRENGFGGLDAELVLNSDLHVRHISNLAEWQEENIFSYGGRMSDSAPKFYSGECAMFMQSSAGRAAILANTDFDLGFAMLPYYDDVEGAPQNSHIGGATLWVLRGKNEADYEGVAKFFAYLSQPEVQAEWHQETGYLPITEAAYELSQEQGYYEANPGADTSILQMNLNPPTDYSKGTRLGNFVQIRDIMDEELEDVWAGRKTPQDALDAIVDRGNQLLREFEAANM
jgi:sn-glycerol 3-phosphate transport system substrate-binding protein